MTNDCCTKGLLSKSPHIQRNGDLIFIDFYDLLRYGEYTAPRYVQRRDGTLNQATRTKHFAVGDVGFWKGICKLSRNSPLQLISHAESTILKIKIRRTGARDKPYADLCPCKVLACRIHHILNNGGSIEWYIFKYRVTSKYHFATVTPTDLITAIWFSVSALKFHHTSIKPDWVGVHSLRAGGACLWSYTGQATTL